MKNDMSKKLSSFSKSNDENNDPSGNPVSQHELNNQGFLGPIGPVGINAPALAYGAVYGSSAAVVVTAGTLVDFTSSGPSLNIAADLLANTLTVATSGIYTIHYNINLALSVISTLLSASNRIIEVALNINGTEDPASISTYSITNISGVAAALAQAGTVSRSMLRSLNSNDVVTLGFRSTSIGPGTATYTSPSLVITRIE
ncbi:hypothetical protein ABE28_012645 [Peribacillus muralis]|uniref:BclA C-terminal domain-containing protein n=1 Tax=Peribacillus muralis TaxID=264697 RepID=A0A1B3XPU3_9BACI|nr:hypothetical protein [Peribacillus muralis]AOH55200.1 hypothetical protein ABE28_012645 [Peribacillus muralis]